MTFQFGQITSASPLALATSFNPLMLDRPRHSAVVTVRKALEELPDEVRESSLEEIAIREKTRDVIATAERLLSPLFYAAFLRWGEAASRFCTRHETDEEGETRCESNASAVRALIDMRPRNAYDASFKAYLTAIEQTDAGCMGPVEIDEEYLVDQLSAGIVDDSPLNQQLQALAALGWTSDPKHFAWSVDIGSAVTREFSLAACTNAARAVTECSAEPTVSFASSARWTEWRQRYTAFEAALALQHKSTSETTKGEDDSIVSALTHTGDLLVMCTRVPDASALLKKLDALKVLDPDVWDNTPYLGAIRDDVLHLIAQEPQLGRLN